MSSENDSRSSADRIGPGSVRNIGEPVMLQNIKLSGVSGSAAKPGSMVQVWTRLALTSDDPLFHRVAENLCRIIIDRAQQAGHVLNAGATRMLLLVMKPDGSGELWDDKAAVSIRSIMKRDIAAGTVVFENDIADVVAMSFPMVNIEPADGVICLFRESWRFGMVCDFNPAGAFSVEEFERTLGTIYRNLKYRHLYDAISDEIIFNRLLKSGWFPFAEIIGSEIKDLLLNCEADFVLTDIENNLLGKFDETRIRLMLDRWLRKPHFRAKENLLRTATEQFLRGDAVSVLKIILTEIEGVLSAAYEAVHGHGAKINKLIEFATSSAAQKAGSSETLLLPDAFAQYLAKYTFANFDPSGPDADAGQRHPVSHGKARPESYTMVRALQALLTLDQIAFYT